MARWKDGEEAGIYDLAQRWQDQCLINGGSLWSSEAVWSEENLVNLNLRFNEQPLLGEGGFGEKFDKQLEDAPENVRRLAAELVAVHFLFTTSVTQEGKLRVINRVLEPLGEDLDPESEVGKVMGAGIGGPGVGFNTRRDLQIAYLIDFSLRARRDRDFAQTVKDVNQLKAFADDTRAAWRREMRQIVLHLLHPDKFERISSGTHKRMISEAFSEFLPDEQEDMDDDDRLYTIREALEALDIEGGWPKGYLDFYWPPLVGVWRVEGEQAEDSEGVSLVEALEWWKQAILYGPPGTSKTYRIKDVAGVLVRRALLKKWKARKYFTNPERVEKLAEGRVEWAQLHPAYGYEEFVRGLRIRDGDTVYEAGVLLHRIHELEKESNDKELGGLPWVLVLDEINRTDLSRMLGEAFSLLEPDMRGHTTELPGREGGASETISVPENLFVIGTMNLIDQSVEQIDFAMRRRFHWHPCRFDRQLLLDIVAERLEQYGTPAKHRERQQLHDQLEAYADKAAEINERISGMDELGEDFEIGHTIFADIARPLHTTMRGYSNVRSYYLWDRGGPMTPITDLWRFQLQPLLNQYLGSLPASERNEAVGELQDVLARRPD